MNREGHSPTCRRQQVRVLEHIFYLIPKENLPAIALVCRTREWALAAQRPLYTSLQINNDHTRTRRRLARTIRTSPHLRQLIQTISMTLTCGEEKLLSLSWLQLIPEGSVYTFNAISCALGVDFATPILSMSFVHSLRHFRCRGHFILTEAHILSCLQLPVLETLSLSIPDDLQVTAPMTVASRLRRLSIWSHSLPLCINPLLRAVGPHLQRLDIDTGVDPSSMDRFPELLTTMAKSLSQLRQLTLRSRYCPERPFADYIPQLMPFLESLHLGYGMFGSALWSHLSIHLRVLRLEHVSTVDFPFDGMENMFKRAGRGKIGLQSSTIFAKGLHCDPAPFVRIGDAHQDCGVDFTVMIYDPSVLRWMDCESHYENGTVRTVP